VVHIIFSPLTISQEFPMSQVTPGSALLRHRIIVGTIIGIPYY
jgi:hypothetical protein